MNKEIVLKQYKGIAIFGTPGSGKTTIAKLLKDTFPEAKYMEAFDMVINPAGSIKDKLPEDEAEFIQEISKIDSKDLSKEISRDEARDLFTQLKNCYTSSVIAKTLIYIHQKTFQSNL